MTLGSDMTNGCIIRTRQRLAFIPETSNILDLKENSNSPEMNNGASDVTNDLRTRNSGASLRHLRGQQQIRRREE
jgi:hypothetical protein